MFRIYERFIFLLLNVLFGTDKCDVFSRNLPRCLKRREFRLFCQGLDLLQELWSSFKGPLSWSRSQDVEKPAAGLPPSVKDGCPTGTLALA